MDICSTIYQVTVSIYYSAPFQNRAAQEISEKQKHQAQSLKNTDLSQFAIRGSEEDWGAALGKGHTGVISIKR